MITDFINYLIRSSLSLLILYLFYSFFLSRERIHRFNRYYLLISLSFSFVVPLLAFPTFITSTAVASSFDLPGFQDNYYQVKTLSIQKAGRINLQWVILSIYFIISLILLIRFLFNLLKFRVIKSSHPSLIIEGHRVVLTDMQVLPYSFFSTVYIYEKEYKEGRIPVELFSHEFTHIAQRHSLDIIFIELLKVIFWINPLLICYKNAIMLNHEYLADYAFTKSKNSFDSYKDILLNTAFRNSNLYLASSFNYSFTKKRLLMMTKNTLPKTAVLKKIAVIPLFLVIGLLVINAQDTTRDIAIHNPPPPPPPPPTTFGNNMWWSALLKEHIITPNPSTTSYSQNLYVTGDECLTENGIVTLEGNVTVLIKSTDTIYRVIKSRSVIFDTKNNTIEAEDGKIETYKRQEDGSKLIHTQKFKNSTFDLVEGDLIAPPPPPPPPPK